MKGAAADADGEMWRWKARKIRERDRCIKKKPRELLQQLHGREHINDTEPACRQRLQTRVLRIDPNTLMMLQLSLTHHSSLSNALSAAAALISPQTFLSASLLVFFYRALIYSHTFHSIAFLFFFAKSRCFVDIFLPWGENLDFLTFAPTAC